MRRRIDMAMMFAVVVAAMSGCGDRQPKETFRVNSFLSSPQELLAMNRVVFVEIGQDSGYPQVAKDATEAVHRAVAARNLFHVDVVSRDAQACRDLPLGLSETYTMPQLIAIREALKCDMVLFGTVSHFRPHPRMQMGLYLRLLDLRRGKLLWAVDHVWDATDKATQGRIEDFFALQMGSGYDPVDWRLALMSPVMFERFVAYEAACTLPARGQETSAPGTPPTAAGSAMRRQMEEIGKGLEKFQNVPQEVADSFDN